MTLCKPCSTFGESNGKTSKFQPKGYSPKIRYQIAIASSVSLFPAGELLVKGEPGPEIITRKSWDFTRPHNFPLFTPVKTKLKGYRQTKSLLYLCGHVLPPTLKKKAPIPRSHSKGVSPYVSGIKVGISPGPPLPRSTPSRKLDCC